MSAISPLLEWVAPAATIIAAIMTAANLGTRITGWGFAIFLLASAAWTALGIYSGQNSLVYANAFLIIVNAVGVWRWLGRQAAYEDGATAAAKRSARAKVPTLFSFNSLAGAQLVDRHGNAVGTIVDLMGKNSDNDIAYIVVSEGGVGGFGEKLHAIEASHFDFSGDNPVINVELAFICNLPVLQPDAWPERL
jgi:PRC-barrel domain